MFGSEITEASQKLLEECRGEGLRVATAESCTGGMIAAALTAIAGSSDVVERGYVTYSNDAKAEMLAVPAHLFAEVGAVSEEVARAMAEGAVERAGVDLAVSATGIAGPGGATESKPIGLVHIAAARRDGPTLHERHVFRGDRDAVRLASVAAALRLLEQLLR